MGKFQWLNRFKWDLSKILHIIFRNFEKKIDQKYLFEINWSFLVVLGNPLKNFSIKMVILNNSGLKFVLID